MIFAGNSARLLREHNERAWLAWHIAAIPRMKRLPKLEKMFIRQPSKKRRQTWQEQMHVMSMWAAVMRRIDAQNKANGKQ